MSSPSPNQVFGQSFLHTQVPSTSVPSGFGDPFDSAPGMGTLSFQPARSLAGSMSLGGNVVSRMGFAGGTGTPTSLPQQPSLNRAPVGSGMINLQNRNLLGQRSNVGLSAVDLKRSVTSMSGSNRSTLGYGMPSGSRGGLFGPHSNFPGGIDSNPPPALDLTEFPSLSNRAHGDSSSQPNPMAGRQPYVGMVKQPTTESSEFTMSSEDFPALPGTVNQDSMTNSETKPTPQPVENVNESVVPNRAIGSEKSQTARREIQTTPDGKFTNIPRGMVVDQFGMIGLLSFVRVAEAHPYLVELTQGRDLTTLGLNLNTAENLYPSFGGPWVDESLRPQDIDYYVPTEYLTNIAIRDKLAPVKLNRYTEDLLFYIFYMFCGDILQLAAAAELYNRHWRYLKDERMWITRAMKPIEETDTYERGMYYFFDPQGWRKVAKEIHLDYDKLEGKPGVSGLPTLGYQSGPQTL